MALSDKLKNMQQNKDAPPVKVPPEAPSQGNLNANQQRRQPEPEPEEVTYDYATPNSDGLTFHFADGTSVTTENGVMRLNQTQHNEIQTLIKKHRRHDISQQMHLVDKDAAEKAARAFLATLEAKKQGHAGASSTAQRHQLNQQLGQETVRNLDAPSPPPADEVDISQMHGGDSSIGDVDLKNQHGEGSSNS